MIDLNKLKLYNTNSNKFEIAIIVVIYSVLNIINYIYYLVPVWEKQGFPEFDPQTGIIPLTLALFCCLTFGLVYPKKVQRYSQFVTWFIFFFVFMPSIIIVAMQGVPKDHGIALIICLSVSMFFIGYIPELLQRNQVGVPHEKIIQTTQRFRQHHSGIKTRFEIVIIYIFFALLVPLVLFYRNIITIVDLTDVYTQREIIEDMSPNKSLEAYALQWLLRVFAPLMIAIGIMANRKTMHILGIFGMVIGFFISGSKFIVFSIPLMYALNQYVFKKPIVTGNNIGKAFLAIFAVTFAITLLYDKEEVKSFIGVILSQILKRAFSINGMTLGNYYDFFINNNNDFTFYSHLGPVSKIIDYPYGEFGIGQIVGHYQVGVYTYDMSAGFWSTDGIAAAGLPGIVLIGIILGLILLTFDAVSRKMELKLLCLASVGNIWMLADTSVFRVLLSGGWPLHFVMISLYWRSLRNAEKNKN